MTNKNFEEENKMRPSSKIEKENLRKNTFMQGNHLKLYPQEYDSVCNNLDIIGINWHDIWSQTLRNPF